MDRPESAFPRLYGDLAWLWPLWEDVEEYRAESETYVRLYDRHSPFRAATLLDLGCGGGKTAHHLRRRFEVTGIDLSENMLAHARELNPGSEFLVGDMRSLILDRTFDAVFVNDAITYMTSRDELEAVFHTARRHLRPGGVMLVVVDATRETFVQNRTEGSFSIHGDLQVSFIENEFDPDPEDTECERVFTFVLRDKGRVRIEHDLHRVGLFSRDEWLTALDGAGFDLLDEGFPPELAVQCAGATLFVCGASR